MANPLPEEKELYERIQSQGLSMPKGAWDFFHHRVSDNIAAIILICKSWLDRKENMPVDEVKRVLVWTKDIKNVLNAVTSRSKDGVSFPQFQGMPPINPIIQELITHQFGNDIYAIELILQDASDPVDPAPIIPEFLQRVLDHALSMQEFIESLGEAAQWKDSEEKYHKLYDSFSDALFMVDMKGNIIDVNQACLDMFGYCREEIKKLTFQKLASEKLNDKENNIFHNQILNNGYSLEYETESVKKDGTVFSVSQKAWLIKNKQGLPLGMCVVVRDITERKNTEKGILEELLDSRMVIDKISDGITVSDAKGHFAVFNVRMQEITGYTIEEANRQEDFNALIYPKFNDRQEALKGLSEIVTKKGYRETQTTIQTRDGLDKALLVSTTLIRYKNRDMFLSVWRDITERKQMMSALQDSELRFRRLFETAQDGILLLDADTGQIREVNPFLIKMLSYSREEFLGKKLWEVGAFIDIERSKAAFQELQANGYVRYEDLPLQTKDGRLINVEFVSNVYDVDHAKVIQCNIRDITERKRLATELFKANGELLKVNVRLKQLTLKDSHTGLYNYRYFKELIEVNFSRAERHGTALSVIIMDIDYFKSINDVYGHIFGDLILKQFAVLLTKTVRPYDVVIRYGGEEFVIVSTDTDRVGAQALARRVLEKVNVHTFGDKVHAVNLKLSLAVASYPEDAIQKSTELVDYADRILNKVKENGGNRVYTSLDVANGARKGKELSDIHSLKEKIGRLTIRASQSLIEETLAFAKTIELKDHYTGKHAEKTVGYAAKISQALHLPNTKVELIKQAAMLHDLGKVGISEHILHKKTKLSSEEYETIKQHPQIGVDIIRPIHSLHPIIPFLLHHHERWDGAGYPHGLAGESIPLGARIIAIADVYQALVSNRPYRKAYSKDRAVTIIKKASGTQFDPDIVKTFLKVLNREH